MMCVASYLLWVARIYGNQGNEEAFNQLVANSPNPSSQHP